MENIVKVGVGLYIFNEHNEVLLGLRKSPHGQGTWCPPGGHLEFGESNEQAAIREAKEETGLDVFAENVQIIGVTNDFFEETNKHYITLHLRADKFESEPKVMELDKCEQWKWFSLDNLPRNLFLPCQKLFASYKNNG